MDCLTTADAALPPTPAPRSCHGLAADDAAGERHDRAADLIEQLALDARLVVSVQALSEFYAVVRNPRKPPHLSHNDASRHIQDLVVSAIVIPLTASLTLTALDTTHAHVLSFWDALIWAAAKAAGAATLYTEDFQHGRDIEGVRIVNPFLPGP